MGKLTVSYNNENIINSTNDGSFTLATEGKLMADDVSVAFEGGVPLTLEVNVDTGSAVTVTNGTTTLTETSANNKCTFTLPEAGTWTASATKDGQTSSEDTKTYTTSQSVTLTYAVVARTTPQTGISYTNGISGLSASELNEIAMAISDNSDITYQTSEVYVTQYNRHISVGDQISYSLGGTSYAFRIMGFNHYELYPSSAYGEETVTGKAGMLFQMKTYLPTAKNMASEATSSMSWSGSVVRSYLNSDSTGMFYKVQADIQGVIKQCKIWYNYGSLSSSSNVCYDYLFIPNATEVGGAMGAYQEQNTSVYAWYAANSGNSNRKKSKEWWLRSPVSYSTKKVSSDTCRYLNGFVVNTDGSIASTVLYETENYTQGSYNISACFCI